MYKILIRTIAICAILVSPIPISDGAVYAYELAGFIVAQDNSPIIAANVKLIRYDSLHAWIVSDTSGRFAMNAAGKLLADDYLEISAIGYSAKKVRLYEFRGFSDLKIILKENPIDLGAIVVESPRSTATGEEHISAEIISEKARRSIIPTNSTSAIRQPQAVRDGSAQSAKIRVNGTSPAYFINGAGMGDDPNHYGMFNIIASPSLSGLDFFAEGTSARYESPSVIEFKTPKPFKITSRMR